MPGPDPEPQVAHARPAYPSGAARLLRSSAVMAAGTVVSRILGMVKSAALAAVIGLTLVASDAFDVANTLPNQLYLIIAGGVLNAVLVPQITKASKHADGGTDFVNRLLTLSLLLLTLMTLVVTAGAPWLVRLLVTDSWSPEALNLATMFAYIALPQVFFYGVYTIFGQVLNAKGLFGAYMWAPALANVVILGGLGVFVLRGFPLQADVSAWTPEMVWTLAGSATLGIVVQAAVLFIPLRRAGFRFTPTWGFRGVGLGSASVVALWTFAAIVLSQLRFVVVSRVLTYAVKQAELEGIVGAGRMVYSNAFLLFMLPHSLITVSLVTALFTRMSHAAADGQAGEVVADLRRGLLLPAVVLIPITVGSVVFTPLVTATIFAGNDPADTDAMARVTIALLLGTLPMSWQYLHSRIFYAYEDARTPFLLQILGSAVIVAITLLALRAPIPWIAVVVGIGQSVGNLAVALVGFALLRRRLGPLALSAVLRQHIRLVLAAVVAAIPAWLVIQALPTPVASWTVGALTLAVIGGGYLVVVLAAAHLLRVQEVGQLIEPLTRRLRRTTS